MATSESKLACSEQAYFFEGAEKLLEIWFKSSDGTGSLRNISRYNLWTVDVSIRLTLMIVLGFRLGFMILSYAAYRNLYQPNSCILYFSF